MIVYAFVLLYANWLMINECSIFFCRQTENIQDMKSSTLHNSSSSVNWMNVYNFGFFSAVLAWRMAVIVTAEINLSLPSHTASNILLKLC